MFKYFFFLVFNIFFYYFLYIYMFGTPLQIILWLFIRTKAVMSKKTNKASVKRSNPASVSPKPHMIT